MNAETANIPVAKSQTVDWKDTDKAAATEARAVELIRRGQVSSIELAVVLRMSQPAFERELAGRFANLPASRLKRLKKHLVELKHRGMP